MTFTTVHTIPRDRYSRPLVIPPGGGKPTAYTRVTTYVDVVEDKYKLQQWEKRMVMLGLTDRPDLLLSAAAHRDDKTHLDMLVGDAVEAAKAHAAATVGTAVHKLAETHDRGLPVGAIPGDYQRDLDAYVAATADFTHLAIEQFMVNDQLKVGGTPDRIVGFQGGEYIADLKTGSVEWGALKIAMQLAVCSRCEKYDPTTGQRQPIQVDQDKAIVIHLPAGTGRCELHWVDIAKGWNAVHTATAVREWRKVKGLLTPINVDAALANLVAASLIDDPVMAAIRAADTVPDLTLAWSLNQGAWTDVHTAAAAERKRVLTNGVRQAQEGAQA